MKNLIVLIAFTFLLGSNSFSQSGIQFSSGNWKELLAQAEKDNKLIFMDAYAEWCGPCKKMAKDVFTLNEVGAFYNAKFVNVKMDMEKGEGVELARKYGIQAYPTLLFLDEKGDVVHRAVGYHTSDLLIGLGEAALDPNRNIGGIRTRYDSGDHSPELLRTYAMAKFDAMDWTYEETAEEYLATQPDWSTVENMEFIFLMVSSLDSKMFDYLLKNREDFERKFGQQPVSGKIDMAIQDKIQSAKSEADIKAVETFYAKIYPEKAEEMSGRIRMGFYAQREDWSNYAKIATGHFKKFPAQDWSELNEIAWIFYEAVESKADLKMALEWAKQSVEMESNYYNNDTMASLYYKLGKKKKALKSAEKAIALAKESGEDYSSTEKLIKQIKG